MVLSIEEKQNFIKNGYIILRDVVPKEFVQTALTFADQAFAEGRHKWNDHNPNDVVPAFNDDVQNAKEISQCFGSTDLLGACEDLIGKGNCWGGQKAQIAFRPFDQRAHDRGMKPTDSMGSHRYHCDGGMGKYRHNGTPFTILIGVCLTEGQDVDELRGQLNVWPGTHFILHEILKERVKQGLIDGHNLFGCGENEKPKIGDPIRVLLKPGDAVIAHQRLGHAGGINLHERTRKNLYFRVMRKNHPQFVPKLLEGSVFTEYDGLQGLLE